MPVKEKISVILPTYNESANILPLIDSVHSALRGYEHEILVIDDNSPDNTYHVALNPGYPYVGAILRKDNRGLANSIRCGLENAGGEIFVVMDSDFNHMPQYIPEMLSKIDSYDCVSASRFIWGGRMNSRPRHHLSRIFNGFIRLLAVSPLSDNLYGFFAIKRTAMESCNYDDIFWGFGDYYMRLLYSLRMNKAAILEIPAVYGERRTGNGNTGFLEVFCRYSVELGKLAFKPGIKD